MNMRVKLIVFLLVCAVLPLLLLSGFLFTTTKQALDQQVGVILTAQVNNELARLEAFFDATTIDLRTWSQLLIMQDVQTDDENGGIASELERLRARYPHFAELIILNGEGKVAASSSEARTKGEDLSQLDAHAQTSADQFFQGHVEHTDLVGERALILASPLRADYDPETIIGSLVGVVAWTGIQQMLASTNISGHEQDRDHRLSLIDHNANILYDSQSDDQGEHIPEGLSGLPEEDGVAVAIL